ncbi:AAA family ATPase [Nocardia sp. NPDC058058]|uniref:helix-turn-helix transcriptional regulator n=1 Tax=Nocardia sp. NPDC058058 TaxID=3346317 RepID=UPI0036D96C5E
MAESLYGRQVEQSALRRALDAARAGTGSALVLYGDPGVGKTALLAHTILAAPDFRVLSCRGTRNESVLAYAALHQLLWPVIDRIANLPAPQAKALHAAFGMSDSPSDPFLVGVGALTLLSELAQERPLLIVADDVQWLDPPSAECLAFLARRVGDEAMLMLIAALEDPELIDADIARLPIGGLDADSARELVGAANPELSPGRVAQLLDITRGNPLALRELAEDDAGQPDSAAGAITLGPRLRQAFEAKIGALPDEVRTLLLIAAAEDGGNIRVIRAAAALLGLDPGALAQADDAGLLESLGERIRVRHPLILKVVYDGAEVEPRRAVHAALAQALHHPDEIDRRAWHLAAASDGPDEAVAELLERSAERAAARGGRLSAAAALRRSAELSPDPEAAAVRLARAARAMFTGGAFDAAREALREAESRIGAADAARASGGLAGLLEISYGDVVRACQLLERDAALVGDPVADELRYIAARARWAAGLGNAVGSGAADLFSAGAADIAVLASLPSPGEPAPSAWRLPPALLAIAVGAGARALELYRDAALELRGSGEVALLALSLSQLAMLRLSAGQWDEALVDATEALQLAEEFGAETTQAQSLNVLAWLAAMRGDGADAEAYSARAQRISLPRRFRAISAATQWHLGVNALGAGRPDTALEHLAGLLAPGGEYRHPTVAVLAAADAVEAAVRGGRPEAARPFLDALTEWAERTGAVWAGASLARARALLTEGPEAETAFLAAIDLADRGLGPFGQARTRLLYGKWLRRLRRRADARVQLTSARVVFDRLGAAPWSVRARRELELAGYRDADAMRSANDAVLTPQELRVARLAAEGATNREIAAQLFISPRTVGHHVSHVFAKLGLSGRDELAKIDFDGGLRFTP